MAAMTAQQTRERILQAAVAEFGAKGYAGARTLGIARRAGVNQQLIAYHFGGKQGLLDELRRRWAEKQAGLVPEGATFADAFAAYLDATLDEPEWAKLVVWQALGDGVDGDGIGDGDGVADSTDSASGRGRSGEEEQGRASTPPADDDRLRQAVERTRARQRAGEIDDRLEPEFVQLLAHVLAFAPIAMPHIVQGIFGIDPLSGEYRRRCRAQLEKILTPRSVPEGARP
ncbi:MAG: TetR/AcrR family transcriptional regulator [Catenulispora sp.]|nr:TetR/AcrR family transcriptional regulator [Catenulispora sp.]